MEASTSIPSNPPAVASAAVESVIVDRLGDRRCALSIEYLASPRCRTVVLSAAD